MVPGSLGLGSVVLAAMTMLAPSAAARLPMARPMPRDAPVMNRVLPFRLMSGLLEGCPDVGGGQVGQVGTRAAQRNLANGNAGLGLRAQHDELAARGSGDGTVIFHHSPAGLRIAAAA